MSGKYHPTVRFPFICSNAKSSRIQLEPFASLQGYGIIVRVIFELTGSKGKDQYTYERTVAERPICQSELFDNQWQETFYEYCEGLYYNKVSQDCVVPIAAMLLQMYCPDIIEMCGLDLSEYVKDSSFIQGGVGFRSN